MVGGHQKIVVGSSRKGRLFGVVFGRRWYGSHDHRVQRVSKAAANYRPKPNQVKYYLPGHSKYFPVPAQAISKALTFIQIAKLSVLYCGIKMAIAELIIDPALRALLSSSQDTLAHILEMLSWVDQNQSAEPSLESQLQLSQHQKRMIAHLAQLRGHNRRAIFGVRATKQETAEARQEVDRLLLQLQNLYYEQRHLMGEISACEAYEYVSIFKVL